jgi:hypothetical protein
LGQTQVEIFHCTSEEPRPVIHEPTATGSLTQLAIKPGELAQQTPQKALQNLRKLAGTTAPGRCSAATVRTLG